MPISWRALALIPSTPISAYALHAVNTLPYLSPLVYYFSYCVNLCVAYLVLSRVRVCEADRRSRFSSPPLLLTPLFSPPFHFDCATLWRSFILLSASVHILSTAVAGAPLSLPFSIVCSPVSIYLSLRSLQRHPFSHLQPLSTSHPCI